MIQFQIRRDISVNWVSSNPTLAQGEMGLETDTNKFKFGNGVSNWNSLPYFKSGNVDSVNGQTGVVTITLNNLANVNQLNAINSGITSDKVSEIDSNKNLIDELETNKQDVITDLAQIRQGASKGETSVQPDALNNYATTQALTEGLATKQPVGDYATKQELSGKQDTITDLAEIRDGATAGATAVQGVQINGTDLTPDANKKVNIPLATNTTDGVLHPSTSYGTTMGGNGTLIISDALAGGESIILGKENAYRPLTARCIDLAVKVGITTNKNTLTDTEKANACNWLGAQQISTIQTLQATDSITLADNTIYNGGEQTALTIALPATVDVSFLCEIDFTSGTTATTLAYPNTIKWLGDDVANNVFVPVASKRYTIIVAYDGVNYRATVKGVA